MDSDSDMYDDGSDVESGGDVSDVEPSGDDFIGNDLEGSDGKNYVVLSDDDIRRLMDEDIAKISSVLSVSKAEASALLRRYNWSVSSVHEAWFADERKVREAVGLREDGVRVQEKESKTCGICFDDFSSDGLLASACGHSFCAECWQGYVSNSIGEGSGCLNLRCPEPSCKIAVSQDMIDCLACDDDKRKYYGFLYRSYVEENRRIKWCPAPGCNFAIEFEIGSDICDVVCNCSNSFCWRCTEEGHRPVDCDMVVKWMEKNNAESENTNWILAYTKPCPQCKKPIEKNEGCMRMTCRAPCKYQFCWLCLSPWGIHGYNPCNKYQPGNDDEKKKEMAKHSIEKYTHYYERWAANEKSRQKAVEDLGKMEEVNVKELSELQCIPETQLKFIIEAWKQIVECRRVLKWTYAYGFYLPDVEQTKRQFFEYLQGQAEAGLERLHHCAEKELEIYLIAEEANSKTFDEFRIKLTGLTSVTKNYFENLLRALENGLEDVDSHRACGNTSNISKNAAGSSSKRWSLKNAAGGVNKTMIYRGVERMMTAMRTRTARLPPNTTNNVTGLNNVLAAGGININNPPNLLINNTLRKPINLAEARGKQLLRIARPGNTTISSSINPVDTLRNSMYQQQLRARQLLQPPLASNNIGSSDLQLAMANTVASTHVPVSNNLTMLEAARMAPSGVGANNTIRSSNLQQAGGSTVMNIGGGSVNAHVPVSNSLNVLNMVPASGIKIGVGASNTMSKTAHAAESSSSSRVGVAKRRRITSNGVVGAPIIINLDDDVDDDELGDAATCAAGAALLSQNMNDDLDVGWACDSCTFLNASSTRTCLMCSEDASGSWECEKCTFVNNKDAASCIMCEHTR